MKTFRHDINERNKSKVLQLRMKHGAAGYGVYMMLLERLAAEPQLRSELDYDMLAYDFHVDAKLIRQVIEDFDLFEIDLDANYFSNDDLNRQLTPKAVRAQQEQILDDFINVRIMNPSWLESQARNYDTSPDRIKSIMKSSFRAEILAENLRIPSSARLCSLLLNHLNQLLKRKE